jgi:hypothetical protein
LKLLAAVAMVVGQTVLTLTTSVVKAVLLALEQVFRARLELLVVLSYQRLLTPQRTLDRMQLVRLVLHQQMAAQVVHL